MKRFRLKALDYVEENGEITEGRTVIDSSEPMKPSEGHEVLVQTWRRIAAGAWDWETTETIQYDSV